LGTVNEPTAFENLTLVLARSPEQEQAFKQFLADLQNPLPLPANRLSYHPHPARR
jgi:hypothetical protein